MKDEAPPASGPPPSSFILQPSALVVQPSSLFSRRRPLFWLSIGFCAGVACDAVAEPSLPALWGLAALALAAVSLCFCRHFTRWLDDPITRLLCLLSRRKAGSAKRVLSPGVPPAIEPSDDLVIVPINNFGAAFTSPDGSMARSPGSILSTQYSVLSMLCGLVVALAGGMLVNALRWRIPVSDDVSRLTPVQSVYILLRGTVVEVSRSRSAEPAGSAGAPDNKVLSAGVLSTERPRPKEPTPPGPQYPVARAATWTIAIDSLSPDEASQRPARGRVFLKAPLPAKTVLSTGVLSTERPRSNEREPQNTQYSVLSTQYSIGEGDVIELRARLDPLPEMKLPEGFDYGAHLQRQGIRRVGVVFPGSVRLLAGPRWWQAGLILRRCSAALARRIEELLPKAEAAGRGAGSQAALLNALLLGRRERLDAGDREAFGLVGTAHLLAISGLHLHFLAAALWWLCRLLGMKRRAAAWLVLLSCCAYCALTGANTPVIRATVMIALYLGAVIFWREPDSLSILGAAALLILFFSPGELFSAGFQLSFLAVLALLTICPVLNDSWLRWRGPGVALAAPGSAAAASPPATLWEHCRAFALDRLPGFSRQALFVSLAAWVGTAPVVAWHMGRFASWSLLVNFVAVPLSGVCMLSGLALLILSALPSAPVWCGGWLAWTSIASLQWVNAAVAGLPGASIDVAKPAVVALVCYAVLWAWVWVERGRRATWWRTVAALLACLLLLHAGALFPKGAAVPSVTILDLGRGRAALVETANTAVLIDAGAASEGPAIAELLRRRGTAKVELLVISEDEPGAIGGARELILRLPVARVVLPRAGHASTERRELERLLTQKGTPYGTPWDSGLSDARRPPPGSPVVRSGLGDLRIAFCDDGPPPEKPAAADSALYTRVQLAGVSLLFAGVRSGAALRRLLAKTCEPREKESGDRAIGSSGEVTTVMADSWPDGLITRSPDGGADEEFLKADVLRLSTGAGDRWPPETGEFVAQTGCRVIIAGQGSDPEEASGLDLAELARTEDAVLLSPHREGTLRVVSAQGPGIPPAAWGPWYVLEAWRGGMWHEVDFGF